MLRRVVWQKFTDVSEVLAAAIIRARQQSSLKRRYISTILHGVTSQKTVIFILAAVRT
jgi:hypothetical protein